MSGEAQKKRAIVRSDLPDEIPPVLANRVQLQQVMLNLITNAIEAMDLTTDSPRLLQVTSTLHSPSNVVIAVRNGFVALLPRQSYTGPVFYGNRDRYAVSIH